MSSDDIDERIRGVLSDVLGVDPLVITEQTAAVTVEEWDSLGHLTVVLALEEEFDVCFDDDETVNLVTFGAIATTVRARLGGDPA